MGKESNIMLDLKVENRNRIFNAIREEGSISGPELSYKLQLSRPTITQNLNELKEEGLIYECGLQSHTGGRRAKIYSVNGMKKCAIGMDITRNHITVIMVDLKGTACYEKRVKRGFSQDEEYKRYLGALVDEAVREQQVQEAQILGVGISVPGLITEDYQRIFYGEILKFTGLTVNDLCRFIPYQCRFYNDADAGGYAEISQRPELTDAFYVSLSNNIGGAILIGHKVYKGEGPRSGEVGHMTIFPDGRECYCGKKGCFEEYCKAGVLADICDGDLKMFFEKLSAGEKTCGAAWEEYLKYLAIAVNNLRMLFDCKIILGGYVGAYIEEYLPHLRKIAAERNTFESNADYLLDCKVKKNALALGSALPFIHEYWRNV